VDDSGRRPSLKARALRHLAAREHSRAELAAKLARFVTDEDEPGAVERVLDELAAKGFIDEARVAESLLHRRAPAWATRACCRSCAPRACPRT
jgi:regulatory protein